MHTSVSIREKPIKGQTPLIHNITRETAIFIMRLNTITCNILPPYGASSNSKSVMDFPVETNSGEMVAPIIY